MEKHTDKPFDEWPSLDAATGYRMCIESILEDLNLAVQKGSITPHRSLVAVDKVLALHSRRAGIAHWPWAVQDCLEQAAEVK